MIACIKDTAGVQLQVVAAYLYCCDPREVKGVKPTIKKCSRGKGMRFTASFLKSELS